MHPGYYKFLSLTALFIMSMAHSSPTSFPFGSDGQIVNFRVALNARNNRGTDKFFSCQRCEKNLVFQSLSRAQSKSVPLVGHGQRKHHPRRGFWGRDKTPLLALRIRSHRRPNHRKAYSFSPGRVPRL